MTDKYKDRITHVSDLDVSIISKSFKAKKYIRSMASELKDKDIWMMKAWNLRFDLRSLVDFLFDNGLDLFDIEFGSIVRLYICKIDDNRITNAVVFSLRNQR